MILAGLRRPADEALPLARQSAAWLDKYLDSGNVETAEAQQVVIALNNVGNRYRIEQQFDEALRLTQRGLDIARPMKEPSLQRQVGGLLLGRAWIQGLTKPDETSHCFSEPVSKHQERAPRFGLPRSTCKVR